MMILYTVMFFFRTAPIRYPPPRVFSEFTPCRLPRLCYVVSVVSLDAQRSTASSDDLGWPDREARRLLTLLTQLIGFRIRCNRSTSDIKSRRASHGRPPDDTLHFGTLSSAPLGTLHCRDFHLRPPSSRRGSPTGPRPGEIAG